MWSLPAKGNITPTGEFNFYKDPEAAFIVLQSLTCPVQLVTWESCLANGFEWVRSEYIVNKLQAC